ncbi:MAG: VanW family protein [Bacillaceae bacterium]
MKWKPIIISASIASVILIGCGIGGYMFVKKTNEELSTYVLPNTTFENISLAKMTEKEVEAVINKQIANYDNTVIEIKVEDTVKKVTWKELGVTYDGTDAAQKIFKDQTDGKFMDRLDEKKAAEEGKRSVSFELTPKIDEKTIDAFIKKNYSEQLVKPVNATIVRQGDKFQVIPGKNGEGVDKTKLLSLVKDSIKTKKPGKITAPTVAIKPKRTTEMMEKVNLDTVIAEYHSKFISLPASVYNAKLGASHLSDVLIAPGEEFSFLEKVGLTTKSRGYLEANTYTNGEVTTGVGGGICQVSSSLYNAALLADLEITERYNHSRPVKYVPYGLDATVGDYAPDLRFKNNTGNYIYLVAYGTNDDLVIKIYGTPTGKKVYLSSQVDYKDDKIMKASAYKRVVKDGVVISDEKLHSSTYHVDKKS